MYLGVKAVIAKSIARIHKGNLLNHGIIPMIFADPADYDRVELEDTLEIHNLLDRCRPGSGDHRRDKGVQLQAQLELSDSELEVISAAGSFVI